MCALKQALAEAKVFGPTGDPDGKPDPSRYTLVPWEEVQAQERKAAKVASMEVDQFSPADGWKLSDKNAAIRTPFLRY